MTQRFEEDESPLKRVPTTAVHTENLYDNALALVRDQLTRSFDAPAIANAGPQVNDACKKIAGTIFDDYNRDALRQSRAQIPGTREDFIQRVLADILGMGPIDYLLQDETIEDIAINGPNEVMVLKHGAWERTSARYPSSERLLELLNRGMSAAGRQANMVKPIADATLPGKQRISVVTTPVTTNPWPVAVIRIPRARGITLKDMLSPYPQDRRVLDNSLDELFRSYLDVSGGDSMMSGKAAAYLHAAVLAGLNIMVVGATGVGKTTLLSALGRAIPEGRRILIIEDTPEMVLNPDSLLPNNVVYLRTRPPSLEDVPAVTQEDLVKLALRQRPDALTLGEARGAEIFDLLNALNTGHRNGLTSLHSEDVGDVFQRVYLMLAQSDKGRFLDPWRAAYLVSNTIHIVVSLELDGSRRRVVSVAEYTGKVITGASTEPEMQMLFRYTGGVNGKLDGLLATSVHYKRFQKANIPAYVYTRAD